MPTENRSSNTELSKTVTEALVAMVSAVTRTSPPAGEPLPGFIQGPIDRAVERIGRLLTQPPAQYQGEPVAPKLKEPRFRVAPCRFGGKDGFFQAGDALVYDSREEAQAAADDKNKALAQRYFDALEHPDAGEVDRLRAALKFYADREHYHFESGHWDTVSGEPLNILWCGDEPDFIEDGSVARAALCASAEPEAKS